MGTENERLHPYVTKAQEQLADGRISRREFLRLAGLMGVSAASAWILAACGAPATPAPAAPTTAPSVATIKRGGVLKLGMYLQAIDHPARLSWTQGSDVLRTNFEYLTFTDRDNVTHPYLLEKWAASEDAKEWTLSLRQGIKWSNGEDFVAEHVKFNFDTWLNPDTGSSILGFFQGFLTPDGVIVKDNYTVVLQFAKSKVDVAENLFHYPAQIVHPSFDGDATTGQNAVTGPFKLVKYKVGEGARVEKREGYWQNGADGQPLPYLDAVEFIDQGVSGQPYVASIQSGAIHEYFAGTEAAQTLKADDRLVVYTARTAQTRVLRMQVDQEPWTDNRVRSALKMCQDRKKIVNTAYFGDAEEGQDCHIAPVQPDYAPIDTPKYDPEGAKKLLAEAGFPDGLEVEITVPSDVSDIVSYITTLQEDAKAAGLTIKQITMPQAQYWDVWTTVPAGVTAWTHRPLAVMLLPLAYIADADGKPVPWNESKWVDQEFSDLLVKAQGIADNEARRAVMKDLERIQQERGSIAIAYWQKIWDVYNPAVQNAGAHPTGYILVNDAWLDPDKNPFK